MCVISFRPSAFDSRLQGIKSNCSKPNELAIRGRIKTRNNSYLHGNVSNGHGTSVKDFRCGTSALPESRHSEMVSARLTSPSQNPSSCSTVAAAVRFATKSRFILSICAQVPHPCSSQQQLIFSPLSSSSIACCRLHENCYTCENGTRVKILITQAIVLHVEANFCRRL